MTSRERVVAALNHRESDRVPVDLGGTDSSGIMGIAYNRLKQGLGLSTPTQVYDVMQMIAKVEPAVLEAVEADAMPVLLEPRRWKPWRLQDGSGAEIPAGVHLKELAGGELLQLADDGTVIGRCPPGGLYIEPVCHPLEQAGTVQDIDASGPHFASFDWPGHADETFEDLEGKARRLYEETSYAIVGNLCVHLFAAGQSLRGFENFMVDLAADKPMAHRLLERQLEAYLPRIERYCRAVGPYVQVILVNDDLGTQSGPQISPALYREMIKPYHRKLWRTIKEKSGKPLLLHSCGSVVELIPDLIELGIDSLNPIQVSAEGMDTRKLKKEFGRDLTFWGGGCDTQRILPHGSVQEVKDEVRRRIDDLAPGGGFVFCQVHNILADVPVENILAMYEAVKAYV